MKIRRGETVCLTSEDLQLVEGMIAAERETEKKKKEEAAAKKRAEEEKKEAAQRAKREKEQAARRKENERQAIIRGHKVQEEFRRAEMHRVEEQKRRAAEEAAALNAKLQSDAAARQKVSEQLRQALEKERQRQIAQPARAPAATTGTSVNMQQACNTLRLQAIARGEDPARTAGSAACGFYGAPLDSAPAQPSTPVPSAGVQAPVQQGGGLPLDQFEYLRSHAVRLQPEQRKIETELKTPLPEATGGPKAVSTFMCGTPPNQYPCRTEVGLPSPKNESMPTQPMRNPFSEPIAGDYEKSWAEQEAKKKKEWNVLMDSGISQAPCEECGSRMLSGCDLRTGLKAPGLWGGDGKLCTTCGWRSDSCTSCRPADYQPRC